MSTTPVRLGKEVNMTLQERIEEFILNHAWFFLSLAIIVLLILFVTFCIVICGASATESGIPYNHLKDVI